jgi:hypothetical protein
MSTAGLLGLESSKSYQALTNITKSLNDLFNLHAQDSAKEQKFYEDSAKISRREKADAERYAETTISNTQDYQQSINNADTAKGKQNAALMGGALLAAALLGSSTALKGAGNLFSQGSDFTKKFTESFEQETQKIEKQGGGGGRKSRPPKSSSTPSTPAKPQSKPQPTSTGDSTKGRPYKIAQSIGFSKKEWDIYRNVVGNIESGNKYNIAGGSGGHYDGRWQLGAAAKTDASRYLGEPDPGHGARARAKYRKDSAMQEKYFAAFTAKNHQYLSSHPKYKNAPTHRKFEILGYAHNQGAGNARNWLSTGKVGSDGFGTKGTKYSNALKKAYGYQQGGQAKDTQAPGDKGTDLSSTVKPSKKVDLTKIKPGGSLEFVGNGSGFMGDLKIRDGNGKLVATYTAASGVPGTSGTTQEQRRNISGKLYPLPDGNYPLMGFTSHPGQYVGDWSDYINNNSGSIAGRGELLVHPDIGGDGTAGCVGVQLGGKRGTEEEKYFTALYKAVQPKSIKVALGQRKEGANGQLPGVTGEASEETFEENKQDARDNNIRTGLNNVVSEFSKFGAYGKAALEFLRGAQASLGLDLFGDLSGDAAPQDPGTVDLLSPSTTTPDVTPHLDTPSTTEEKKQQTPQEKQEVQQLKKKSDLLKKIKKTSHPDTGKGYTVDNLIDYHKRPAVFSEAAAYHFARMMEKAGGAIKGQDINSTKRSRRKNTAVKGHPNSVHLYGEGIDAQGSTMKWLKSNGSKFGWNYGYNHGPGSAHFDYKGPRELDKAQLKAEKKQSGGIVGMQSGGSLGAQFNSQHGSQFMQTKYGRPIVIVKRRNSSVSEPAPNTKLTDTNNDYGLQQSQISTSMYKIQMGALI